jgi:hypothetical protein
VTLFAPDCVRDTFVAATDHGGYDGEGRALRYLEWRWDPEPEDSTYLVDFAYLLRESGRKLRVLQDRNVCGLFGRATWVRLLRDIGFQVRSATRPDGNGALDEVFVAVRP